jgi:hypothetical protein
MTEGKSQFTLLIEPSNPNSPKNNESCISQICAILPSFSSINSATAIGKSKLVPTFLISEGDKFNINLRFGNLTQILRNDALKRSLDSLIAASGNPMISIFGKD